MLITKTLLIMLVLVLVVGGILLQIFLSRRESRWPGLILPAITLLYSLLMCLSLVAYVGITTGEIVMLLAKTFLMGNLPTLVLLGIYFACREKRKRRAQLDKMNIQDLS